MHEERGRQRNTFAVSAPAGCSPSPKRAVTTVILAGGLGTRLKQCLKSLPKPMAPASGRPFIEWMVRYLACCGLQEIVISTGYLGEAIEKHFAARPVPEVQVECRRELTPLGTAGGFLNAIEGRKAPADGWLVSNGDSLAFSNPLNLVAKGERSRWRAAILGLKANDASRYGTMCAKADGTLLSFAEKQAGPGLINAGLYWFDSSLPERFDVRRPLSFEADVIPGLLHDGIPVGVVEVQAPFLDIGIPESLAQADSFIRANCARLE